MNEILDDLTDNIIEEIVEYSQELYEKNIQENDFSRSETDGIGDEEEGK